MRNNRQTTGLALLTACALVLATGCDRDDDSRLGESLSQLGEDVEAEARIKAERARDELDDATRKLENKAERAGDKLEYRADRAGDKLEAKTDELRVDIERGLDNAQAELREAGEEVEDESEEIANEARTGVAAVIDRLEARVESLANS